MFIPLGTLITLVVFAFMLGMLLSFVMVIKAMMRLRK
jgi:hypothetical protein